MRTLLLALMLLASGATQAHKASDAYLQLAPAADGTTLRIDVALRDLDLIDDLDADGDGRITAGEMSAAWPRIERSVLGAVDVAGCPLHVAGRSLERRSDGAYAALQLASPCRMPTTPVLRYRLLRDVDPTHRGLLRIGDAKDGVSAVQVLDPAHDDTPAETRGAAPTGGFVAEGVHHILTGFDHLLFLLCLLLPAAMRRVDAAGAVRWQPVDRFSQALLPVAGIVSAFTLAHSVTLGAAALGWIALPSSFIEPAIAATIVLAAFDNLRPIFRGPRWIVALVFGLIHGFGFAGVLAELSLPPGEFAWALLQFNVGLEAGQLAVVVLAVALLFASRHLRRYPAVVIRAGSAAALIVGMVWFVERTADLPWLST